MWFWIWIVFSVVLIVGLSVLIGKMVGSSSGQKLTPEQQQRMTALKASGALRHRKSNRN